MSSLLTKLFDSIFLYYAAMAVGLVSMIAYTGYETGNAWPHEDWQQYGAPIALAALAFGVASSAFQHDHPDLFVWGVVALAAAFFIVDPIGYPGLHLTHAWLMLGITTLAFWLISSASEWVYPDPPAERAQRLSVLVTTNAAAAFWIYWANPMVMLIAGAVAALMLFWVSDLRMKERESRQRYISVPAR
jgi:hypothetical protein